MKKLRRAAHRQVIDLQGWLAHAYRQALTLFAANAHAVIQLQVVTHHGNLLHGLNARANQGCALHRFGHFALLNQIRL